MNTHVDHARAFVAMLRDLDVPDPAQGAAALIEATAKALPLPGEDDPEQLKVRISNLEAQNDNLRVNNQALRDALELLKNPVQVVTNNHFISTPEPPVYECPRCGHKPATFRDGACTNCGEPSK